MKVRTKAEIHDHIFDEYDHQGLTPNTIYPVIGIDAENYRLLGDNNDPVLYPKYLFTVVDAGIPDSWVRRELDDGEYFIDPPEMSERAFWDRYHDGDPQAIAKFRAYVARVSAPGE